MKEFTLSLCSFFEGCKRNGSKLSLFAHLKRFSHGFNISPSPHVTASAYLKRLTHIAFYLREPLSAAHKLLKQNKKFLRQVEKYRNHNQSITAVVSHVAEFQIPQRMEFNELCSLDKRSKIVASFHLGDFVYGLHKLLCMQDDTSRTVVLSQKISSHEFISNMKKGFGEKGADFKHQLLLKNIDIRGLSEFLRTPESCLVMFADLPAEFGETTEVEFLGRTARFSKSIALLSLANRVPVLPVICFSDNGAHQVQIGQQIEPQRLDGETRADAITRITQLQVDFLQHFLVCYKEQWRYLYYLPDYFSEAACQKFSE